MSEAVANIDRGPDCGHGGPGTPHTPGMPATPNTPGTGHKSPRSHGHHGLVTQYSETKSSFYYFIFRDKPNKDFTNEIKTDFNLEDLNFDPAAIIGDNNGDWNVRSYLQI